MEKLTEPQYEQVLEFMQETNEENFESAYNVLAKFDFRLEVCLHICRMH